ncbi:hypothetical protein ACFYZJ_37685 [Streptomyces sp. NPDC001848]|uniref:hypothetical protein n=1 Tax=Streptomyces sp. NPDC001848 TaxID=3364618 RepID=UPI003692B36A
MSPHDLALASLGVWLALAALAAVNLAVEIRCRRYARQEHPAQAAASSTESP